MSKFLQLPNGALYEVPDTATYEEAMLAAQKDVPKAFGLEKKGIGAALGQGLESLISSGQTAFGALTGSAEEAGRKGVARQERIGQQYAEQTGLDLLKKKYEEEGLISAGKELARQVPLAIAEQAPNIGATLAAGRAGAALGSFAGPVGAVVGGLGGAAIPSLVSQFGGNIERQAKEGQPVDVGAAGAAAVPQAALDVAGTFIPFGRTVLGKALGPGVAKALEKGAGEAAERLAQESLKKSLAKGLGVGAIAEIPTEITQQMLERAQAGLSLTSEDALAEYGNTAYQVGLLAPIGAAGRVVDRSAARKDIAQKQAAEAEAAAAKAEQERLASPAYFDELTAQQAKLQEQLANMEYGLGRAKKDDAKARLQDRIDAKQSELADVQAKLAAHPLNPSAAAQAQASQLEQLQAEETGIPAELAQQQEEARLAAEEQAKQQRLAMGEGQQRAIAGFEPRGEFIPTPDVATQRAELDNQTKSLSAELAKINARIEAQQKELAAAAAAGDTTKAMELMAQAEKDKTPAYKAELERQLEAAKAQAAELKKADPAEQLKALQKQFVKAGDEGNFEAIKILAPQIEALKQQVPAAPAAPAEPALEREPIQREFFTDEGETSLFAKKAEARRIGNVLAAAQKDLRAQVKKDTVKPAQKQAEAFMKEQAEQPFEPTAYPNVELGEKLGVPQKEQPATGGRRVLGRPAQPMKLEQANQRVDSMLRGYEELVSSMAPEPTTSFNQKNKVSTKTFGGYMDAAGHPVSLNVIRRADNTVARIYAEDELGRRTPVQQDFGPDMADTAIANEVAKANEWTRPNREQFTAATEEAKNKVIDTLLGKADSVRMDSGLPRLDDQAAMELAAELNDIIVQHTSKSGTAPQLGGRLSQAVTRFAKPTIEEKQRALSGMVEDFALEPQTAESLAAKVAQEEGAGKTNRSDVVSEQLQKALDTDPTGAIRTVLEEAKRIVDTGKAPSTLIDEAEAQSLRILNGKTPQMRTLYDETVIAKEGKVTEEAQQHFPQFAQRGTIRQSAEKFRKFLNSPRIEFKREEYKRKMAEFRELLQKSTRYGALKNAAARNIVEEYNKAVAIVDRDVQDSADYLKFLKTEIARPTTPWAKEVHFEKEVAKVEAFLKEASAVLKQMDSMLDKQLAEVEVLANQATAAGRKSAREMAGLKTTTEAQRRETAKAEAALKAAQDKAEKARREWDIKLEEATKLTPKVVSRAVTKEVSANDIRYLKKMRSQAQADLKTANTSLKKMPDDAEFTANKADAETRLANINKQLAEVVRAGGKTKGQPVGAAIAKRVVERIEPESEATKRERLKEERKAEALAAKEAAEDRKKRIAKGVSSSVMDMRNEIEKLNERLAEKNAKGKNALTGTARAELVKKRTALNKKLEAVVKRDRLMLAITRNEEVPGGMITPQKIVKGTNIAKVEAEAKAEREAALREDEDAMADIAFAQATLLRKAETPVSGKIDLKAARALADKVKAKLAKSGIKLEYYDSVDTADARAKSVYNYHGVNGTTGFIYPDGTVVVFGDAHKNMRDLEETIAHEVIGHYGVEGMLGAKGISDLTDKLFETDGLVYRVAEALGVWDAVRATEQHAQKTNLPLQKQRMLMVQELIAHVAEERGIPKGMVETAKRWIKLVVNAIRNAFSRNGLDDLTKATTREIQQLIDKAERNYIENRMPAYVNAKSGEVKFRSKVEYAPSYNPELQNIANKVFAKNQSLKDKIKANATGLNFAIQFVDRFAGLEAVAKQMKDQLAAFQMMYWNRSYDARNMVVAETATNGPRKIVTQKRADGNTEKVIGASGAPGLKAIAEEVGKSSKRVGNANAALQQFGLYLVAKRAKRVGIDVAFGKNSSITPAQLDDIIRNGDADPNFKKAAGMYAEYNKGLMNFLKETGAISDKEFNDLTKYGDYVGFYREKDGVIVDGEHNITIGDLTHNKFLKELLGSDQAIIDFQSSALQNTSLVTDIGLRNLATKNTAYTLRDLGLAKVLDGTGPAKGNVVRFKEHGKDKYAVIDDVMGVPAELLVKGMEGISTSLPTAIRFMQGPANLLRKGVTRMPLYAVRQIIRDSLASTMTAGVDAAPVTSALKQMGSLIKGTNETERKLQEKGLIGGQVFSATPDDMKLILQDIAAGKDHWTTLMSKLDHLAMKADAASRVTAYNSYVKQGMSDMEASLAALEMMNFTKRGLSPNMLLASNMIPFFNAQVQGLAVLAKAFRGTSMFQNKLDIKGKLLKRGAMMAALTMLYAAMMADDEAYKNATPEEKYNNWFVYLPGFDEPVRVPIPFEIGYIFKALPEAVFNMALGDEKASTAAKAFKQMAINTIPGGSNMLLPQALKPAVEVAANYSFFTGKPIEGSRLQGMEPAKRYGAGTTELAKAMGELLDVSPTQIDYLVRGYTGGLGAAIVALLNPLLASPEKPGTPEKKMSELSFIGQAFQPTDGRGLIQEAYDTMQRINQAKGSYNKLLEDGMLKEAEEFAKNNATLIGASSAAGKFRQYMGELAKQVRQVQGDPTMTPKEKRDAIDAIRQEQIALSKQLRSIE